VKRLPIFVVALLLSLPLFSKAAATPWKVNPHGQVRLIAANDSLSGAGPIWLGFQFKPATGWYLYWKDPGEAGMPPHVDWKGSEGLAHPEMLWPMPEKLILPGNILEYGYPGEIVYPVRATAQTGGVKIEAKLSYLTCYTSCVPYTYTFTLNLPESNKTTVDLDAQSMIKRFAAQVPPENWTDQIVKTKATAHTLTPGETPVSAASASGLMGMLFIALLGGIILNVMPCVLPVLSIKLAGLLQHSGQGSGYVVKSSLASAAGILVSFLGLALTAIVARAAGHAIGWGIQFQNPIFVTFLLAVVLFFAANLWGFFEIQMPRFLGNFATSFGYHETLAAHFMSGFFATLLATPCSAPFLGTAMGFALSQSAPIILLIFGCVGLGMSMPYLALAAFPESVRWLPKPGAWMITLKKGLALLLAGTALWLGWVLYQQLQPVHAVAASEWVPFNEAAIDQYVGSGKSIFVDVTADWCVTCKYNEKVVLNDPEVMAELKRQSVVLMKADWTKRNPDIAAYLMKHGRAGIPFYAFYTPHHDPILLSEFLTKKKVLNALHRADRLP
jgi:suppressor for copper-sensitivity B